MPYADPSRERERQRARRKRPEWSKYHTEWFKRNRWKYKDRINTWKRDWCKKNRELVRACSRKTYLKHQKSLIVKQRAYYIANKSTCNASAKRYAAKHVERLRQYKKQWACDNIDKVKRYRQRSQARRRTRMSGCASDHTAAIFYEFVRSKKSIPCYYCGKKIPGKKAHIDHVIAVSRKGNHASDNLCASCPGCNLSKGKKLPSELVIRNQPLLNF